MEKICGSIIINSVKMYENNDYYHVSINENHHKKSKDINIIYIEYLKVLKLQSQQVIRLRGNTHHKTNRYISHKR
jgi:hypothetical protein